MEELTGINLPTLPVSGLEHQKDLVYFEGPFLRQYIHPNGDHYLYYWCDCEDDVNRWMLLRVKEANILRLTGRVLPMDCIIPKGCQDDYVYFVDMRSTGAVSNVTLCRVADVPDDYCPAPGEYLEAVPMSVDGSSYAVLVEDGGWTGKQLADFPRKFSNAYALLFSHNVLGLRSFEGYPWRGGFSAMHFYEWLVAKIPFESKPVVQSIQYASPGFMRFNADEGTAMQVVQCVRDYHANNAQIAGARSDLNSYIRGHSLNDTNKQHDWTEHNPNLLRFAKAIMDGFSCIETDRFVEACQRPFEAAKASASFARQIRLLNDFEKEGHVRFPRL